MQVPTQRQQEKYFFVQFCYFAQNTEKNKTNGYYTEHPSADLINNTT